MRTRHSLMRTALRRFGAVLAAVPLLALTAAVPAPAVTAQPAAAARPQVVSPMAVGSRLVNRDSDTAGKCLEIAAGGTVSSVQMASCHTNAHQSWYFTSHTGGYVAVRSHDTDAAGECLTSRSEGLAAYMNDCVNAVTATQAWVKVDYADGWFQLRNKHYSNQCLDVRDNGLSYVVQVWLCGPSTKYNQLWRWASVG